MNLYDDLPLAERLMDLFLDAQLSIIESIRGMPIDFIMIADDIAFSSGLIVSEGLLREIWIPRVAKLVAAAKSFGVPIEWHCCGKLDQVIPILVDWGIDAIHPVQAACNDIYNIKKQWGELICLIGNINIGGVLAFGSPEEVEADSRQHIELLSHNGGYVLASSHSIVDAIPQQNFNAMIETAVDYGKFIT